MNFSALYQRAQQQVSDTSANTLINLKNYLNDGQQDFISRRAFWSFLLANSTFSTTAGTQQYSLASDVYKIINLRDETNETYLKEINRKQFELMYPYVDTTNDRNKPTMWYPTGIDSSNNLQVKLYPVPDGTYTIRYDYYKRLSDLTADTDTSTIPARYHRALVYYACARYFELKQDPMANYYDQKYENEIIKALEDQFEETDGQPAMIPSKSLGYSGNSLADDYFLRL